MTEHHERTGRDDDTRRALTRELTGRERVGDETPRSDAYDATAAAPARGATGASERDVRERDERISEGGERIGDEAGGASNPLFPTDQADSLRSRWDAIQTEFVDQPRAAVEKADALVGDVMQRLADGFSHERTRLEKDWDRGDGVSTEDLRVALKRYRSFFDRLLSV